jgi:hypothetical protein
MLRLFRRLLNYEHQFLPFSPFHPTRKVTTMSVDVSLIPDSVLQPLADLAAVKAQLITDAATKTTTATALLAAKAADSASDTALAADATLALTKKQAADQAIEDWINPPVVVVPPVPTPEPIPAPAPDPTAVPAA